MAEQMKTSGIDWIGNIPINWKCSKVKFCFFLVNGSTPESSDYDCWDGDIRWITPADMNDTGTISQGERFITKYGYNSCGTTLLPAGSIVVSSRAPIGKINITTAELCTNQGCKSLIRNGDNRYFYYLFLAGQHELSLLGRGTTFLELSTYDLNRFGIVIPDKDEQQAIADYLDKECAQIDSIAADLEKQIALLQQYKKSLITETVTKGLDKSVPMKDSGIEWIGKIPDHWQKTRIKFESSIIGSGTTPDSGNSMYYDNGEHSWIQSGDLYGKDYIYETEKQLTNLAILECRALNWYTKDFVVVAMYGASVGNVAISKIDSFTNQACCVIKLNKKNDNRYLFYFLKAAQEEMLLKAFGGTQPNISQVIIKNLNFLNVPLLEQIEIADFLDGKCDVIDEMLQSKKDQYDVLIKHKKSLIYEYVTGKKRVKEVQ